MKKCAKNSKTQGILSKISIISKQDTGVGWYRLINPGAWLEKNKLALRVLTTKFTGNNEIFRIGKPKYFKGTEGIEVLDDSDLIKICRDTDIIWTTVIYDYDEIIKILDLREMTGARWVVDMDDNIYAVTKDNPAQSSAKSLTKNLETCFRLADGLTVSVPMLKNLYSQFNKNIFVQKNCINFNMWDYSPKGKHDGIRIGWEGAYGHKADVEMIYPVIKRLQKDYPEKKIKFVTFGPDFGFNNEHHNWVSLKDYPEALSLLDLDIAVAPLVDSNYNRCKSNIRLLENSALKYPIVASPTENQRDLPVLYAKNNFDWYMQLEKLILNKELRKRLGQIQYDYIKKYYDIRNNVSKLADWFYDLERRKDVSPDKAPPTK